MVLFEDHAPGLAAAFIAVCVFGYLTYGLRAYTRIKYSSWGPEEWCMTAAITMTFFALYAVRHNDNGYDNGLYIIFHTVGLTAAEDYLYAVSEIVIWGPGTDGGNIKIRGNRARVGRRLRGNAEAAVPEHVPAQRVGQLPDAAAVRRRGSRYAFPGGNSRRAYTEFGPESEYELGSGGKNAKKYRRGDMITSTRMHDGGGDGASSDSGS
ncbi:hypothetical protein DL769_011062 [Monosporascus sp. CRB-8-3]|nr:hypothetical protein DL769_011062 [Monosporascus sp. CRB-8-3]